MQSHVAINAPTAFYNQIRKPKSSWSRGRWSIQGIKCLFTRYSPAVVPEVTHSLALVTHGTKGLIKYQLRLPCSSPPTIPSSDPAPSPRGTPPPRATPLLGSLLANYYLPTGEGVQDPRRGVCDGGPREEVVHFVGKHGDLILTIHPMVAEFGHPLVKDVI